jgi:AbrB family looped-hinge helix DNA binding protein
VVGPGGMQKTKVDAKGRVTIPAEYRKMLGLRSGTEVLIIPREDYLLMTRTSTPEDLKNAAKRLAEEIIRRRRKPIRFEKLF